ncbi:MAG: response regulator [Deltaproteobacteria bacterium]|nr:response regulator [Deltaproteobacteria bacterium]
MTSGAGKLKILIVDDSSYYLRLGGAFLKRSICKMMTAQNGKIALSLIKEEQPDLVIMDFKMPVMNGDECCRLVKADDKIKNTPIVMMANAWDLNAKEICEKAGCDYFAFKPVNKPQFYHAIRKYLNLKERSFPRVSSDAAVSYFYNKFEDEGKLLNISECGMFLKSIFPLREGAEVSALFKLTRLGDPVKVKGKVVRAVNRVDESSASVNLGMGIKFISPSDYVKSTISHYKRIKKM